MLPVTLRVRFNSTCAFKDLRTQCYLQAEASVLFLVCVSISPLERVFVQKILSCTQRATVLNIFVGFSLKSLCCRDPTHSYDSAFKPDTLAG